LRAIARFDAALAEAKDGADKAVKLCDHLFDFEDDGSVDAAFKAADRINTDY
jgi:hypothetical protein